MITIVHDALIQPSGRPLQRIGSIAMFHDALHCNNCCQKSLGDGAIGKPQQINARQHDITLGKLLY
jgi:hypothetical protein